MSVLRWRSIWAGFVRIRQPDFKVVLATNLNRAFTDMFKCVCFDSVCTMQRYPLAKCGADLGRNWCVLPAKYIVNLSEKFNKLNNLNLNAIHI